MGLQHLHKENRQIHRQSDASITGSEETVLGIRIIVIMIRGKKSDLQLAQKRIQPEFRQTELRIVNGLNPGVIS